MRSFLEILIFAIFVFLYWASQRRRRYFKKKRGNEVYNNLKVVSRNIAYMICPDRGFHLKGKREALSCGAILYSFHFGVWELMPEILNSYGRMNIGILVDRYTALNPPILGKFMDKILYIWRARFGVKIFYPEDVFKIVKFLKNGGIFATLVDGDTLYAKYKKIERLAKICGVPLIPFVVYRDCGKTLMEINCNFEEHIKNRPDEYWWFYKSRTKTRSL